MRRVWLSAATGEGVDLLVAALGKFLGPTIAHGRLRLGPQFGRARARLYSVGAVLHETPLDTGEVELDVSMPVLAFEQLCRSEGISPAALHVE